jgi:osmoprotectant transport system substrate-binding protein
MRNHPHRRHFRIAATALAATVATVAAGCSSGGSSSGGSSSGSITAGSLAKNASLKGASFTVGGKEFTEQLILCHMTADALKSAGASVKTNCGISGSNSTRTALTSGSIDMYWEYTGTAWIDLLKHTKPIPNAGKQYQAVAKEDLAKNDIKWLDRAPANDSYAIDVKASTAKKLGVHTLSDYAKLVHTNPSKARICLAAEFSSRPDGFPGVQKAYKFQVPKNDVAILQEGAIYHAVSQGNPCKFGEVDATTDARIQVFHLALLKDDKNFFPTYNPALTVRQSVYKAHPGIAKIINPIAAKLTTATLRKLNGKVDVGGGQPNVVARTWLQKQGFIGKS